MTDEQLNEIKALCEKATPGPWEMSQYTRKITSYKEAQVICTDIYLSEDYPFIAHARSTTSFSSWLKNSASSLFCHR